MTLKVIGAGFGRTGTASLQAALEELGYSPCYHMHEVLFKNPGHAPLWEAAWDAVARGEYVDWEELLAGYQATVDWPGASFYRELMEAYPEAKVLLSVRAPEKWYKSTKNTIYTVEERSEMLDRNLQESSGSQIARGHQMIRKLVWEGTFGGSFEDRRYAIEVFERHNEEVKEHVPANRLLVYEVKEGWGPLCEFLQVEVPEDKPFPHLNDTNFFRNRVEQWAARGTDIS
jgi:hypothetical protein